MYIQYFFTDYKFYLYIWTFEWKVECYFVDVVWVGVGFVWGVSEEIWVGVIVCTIGFSVVACSFVDVFIKQ